MSQETFKALVVEQIPEGVRADFQDLTTDALPEGDVLVAVHYSSLNYKDALAVTNKGKVIRAFPFVPGIDFAGVVEQSQSPNFKPGDQVVLTGWGVGERHWGGYAQKARVKADWLVPLPEGLSLKEAMGIGTAGFTAMLCVIALEKHGLVPGKREILVTGAAGGVGSVAVTILAKLGYNVTASTGRTEAHEYLKALGASQILDRHVLTEPSKKPLESERWGGAVDTVGGDTLNGVLRSMAYNTSVAACGLAGGSTLNTTVFPFILRAVSLLGVESVLYPRERRLEAWARLVRDLPLDKLNAMMQLVPFEEVPRLSQEILKGRVRGRVVVDVNK